jgi:hypothetical protein
LGIWRPCFADSYPFIRAAGKAVTISNILSGQGADIASRFFDLPLPAGNEWPIKQTLAAFSPKLPLPQLKAAPMGFAHRIASVLSRQNVNVHLPGTSQRICVSGPNEESIRATFTPNLLEFLTIVEEDAPWHFQGCAGALVVYRVGYLAPPEQYPNFVDATTSIATTFLGLCGPGKSS